MSAPLYRRVSLRWVNIVKNCHDFPVLSINIGVIFCLLLRKVCYMYPNMSKLRRRKKREKIVRTTFVCSSEQTEDIPVHEISESLY